MLKAVGVSVRGNRNTVNQDAYLMLPHEGIFAVADGVGGRSFGEIASQRTLGSIAHSVRNTEPTVESVRDAIERANREVYELAKPKSSYASMASTLVLARIEGDNAQVFYVGDSRAYVLGRVGLDIITQDHVAFADNGKKGICRAIGYSETVDIDVRSIRLELGESLLLITDGITDMMTSQELYGFLQRDRHAKATILNGLVEAATEKGGDDDKTVLLIHRG